MIFLRDKIVAGAINDDLVKAWFMFPEVKQNWLGFSLHGNGGSGLGKDFADALNVNLQKLFSDFGRETITKSSHIEKVCLVRSGVGRDMISDFTTNLLKDFICRYTEKFAVDHIDPSLRKQVTVNKALFNYESENWERGTYDLPYGNGDFVLLTPKDILTRDENWINRTDMIRDFEKIPVAIPDAELRGQVFNYFQSFLDFAHPGERFRRRRKTQLRLGRLSTSRSSSTTTSRLRKTPETQPLRSAPRRCTRLNGYSKVK